MSWVTKKAALLQVLTELKAGLALVQETHEQLSRSIHCATQWLAHANAATALPAEISEVMALSSPAASCEMSQAFPSGAEFRSIEHKESEGIMILKHARHAKCLELLHHLSQTALYSLGDRRAGSSALVPVKHPQAMQKSLGLHTFWNKSSHAADLPFHTAFC